MKSTYAALAAAIKITKPNGSAIDTREWLRTLQRVARLYSDFADFDANRFYTACGITTSEIVAVFTEGSVR